MLARWAAFAALPVSLFAAPVSYQREVRPLLESRCRICHSPANRSGNVSLASFDEVRVAAPRLLEVVSGDKPRMPKFGKPLTSAEVDTLRRWVAEGAPNDADGPESQQTWWSLSPLARPALPVVAKQNPIDAFLEARLREANLGFSPEADRRTLIRRAAFDLHGLPPTPAEVEAFVSDTAPNAWERLIDRLLASPRYGERWARHWLDVIHYGDSHGYDKDKPRANAWPYRDWVIRALNQDKPWDRFIREQVAGDVLFPDDPQALVATGFLAAGPWDFVGHQELKEGTTEKDNTRLLDRDDMVAATISSFTSMTAHCARCHDHKFDPIPQNDYYNLQAVFAGVDRADRPFDDDPALYRRRRELLARKLEVQRRLQPLLDKVEFAATPEITDLDSRIQDASLLIVHMGEPKTPAEATEKQALEARRAADRKRRQELVDALVGSETYAAIDALKAEMKPVDDAIAALPKPSLVYAPAVFFPRAGAFRPALQPRPVHVLNRGSVQAPGALAEPGALRCVPGLEARFQLPDPSDEGARRAALAQWLAAPENVLTWRSAVNRVWHYHFGAGIVDTPSDFGRMGSKPTHPELLDWLAVWFRDDARGSLKALHRLILTSAAYRQQSANRPDGVRADADNRLLWRMNRMRLDAEAVRDSVLEVSGKLDPTPGGPAARWFFFKDDHSPVYDYQRYDPDEPGAHRRSIYRFIVRSVPDPFMERLDCPDPSILTPKRSTTLTAIQALALLNNPFMVRMAEHFAARLSASTPEAQVTAAFQLALNRPPASAELPLHTAYIRKHGLPNWCRLLFNTNEFLFVD